MSSIAAILGIIGGVVGVGGGVAGNLIGGKQASAVNNNKQQSVSGNPNTDPLLAAARGQILAQLGLGTSNVPSAGPIEQVRSQVSSSMLGGKNANQAQSVLGGFNWLQTYVNQMDPNNPDWAQFWQQVNSSPQAVGPAWQSLTAAGYSNWQELAQAELAYKKQQTQVNAQSAITGPQVQAGNAAALAKVSQLQQDFPIPTQSAIDQAANYQRNQESQALLAQANVGGFNPAAGLAQIQQGTGPLANALALLGGQGAIAGQAIGALQNSVQSPTALALQGAGLGTSAALNQQSIGAQQAAAYNQMLQAGAQAGGSGIAAAGGAAGQGLLNLALLSLLTQKNNPGVGQAQSQYGPYQSGYQMPPLF